MAGRLLLCLLVALSAPVASFSQSTSAQELVDQLKLRENMLASEEDKAHPSYREWKRDRAAMKEAYDGEHRSELKQQYIEYADSSDSPKQVEQHNRRLEAFAFHIFLNEDIKAGGNRAIFLKDTWLLLMKERSRPGALPGVNWEEQTLDEAWEAFTRENEKLAEQNRTELTEYVSVHQLPEWFWELALVSARGEFYELMYMAALEEFKTEAIKSLESEIAAITAELDTKYPEWRSLTAPGQS